jgi:hypothetical protein
MTTNKEFNPCETKDQVVTDWSGKPVVVKYAGRCLGCSSTVYDGADDPRGVTGPKHFNDGFEADGKKYPACFECMNDGWTYRRIAAKLARLLKNGAENVS